MVLVPVEEEEEEGGGPDRRQQIRTGGAEGRSRSTRDSPSTHRTFSYIDSYSPAREAAAGLTCSRVLDVGRDVRADVWRINTHFNKFTYE